MSKPTSDMRREILRYATGYALALALSGAAFAAVHWRVASAPTTLAVVLLLALVQAIVHFRWFLHISFDRSSREDLQLILFSSLIITLMVGGTLVLLFNLAHRMM